MARNNAWKKTEEAEIDLIDLMRRLCGKWKQIALCALAAAVLASGYGWLADRSSAAMEEAASAGEIELTQEEERNVENALQLAADIAGMEQYMQRSVLMQIDPKRRKSVVLLYSVDGAQRGMLANIIESYLVFLQNEGAADALRKIDPKTWDMEKEYLMELIVAWQKTEDKYEIAAGSGQADTPKGTLLYVELIGSNAKMAGRLAEDIQSVIGNYMPEVQEACGEHSLTLLRMENSMRVDNELQSQKREKTAMLNADRNSLEALTENFNAKQKAVYRHRANVAGKRTGGGICITYVMLGLFGGMFVYCAIYACWYLLCDAVKNTDELKRYYTVPFYGGIPLRTGRGKQPGRFQEHAQKEKEQLFVRIKFACKSHGVSAVCLAADTCLQEQEKECLDDIVNQLQEAGIDAKLEENIMGNAAAWETLFHTGTVLAVYRIGSTTHRMINEEMAFYEEYKMAVLGAVSLG